MGTLHKHRSESGVYFLVKSRKLKTYIVYDFSIVFLFFKLLPEDKLQYRSKHEVLALPQIFHQVLLESIKMAILLFEDSSCFGFEMRLLE